ncbi:CBN-SMGL-1 protein [Caenorhabditis brenneri]|uniref:CBN-SMGL-1 protein n=1 Tax=Caenorhabditis brenneri TaxID=135651 RepID=G0MFH7_CAEBE|nr:CBN-SMGL-1 protein [Caenorhabditis brenneri]
MAHMRGTNHEKSKLENEKILLKERYPLIKWQSNVEMRTPNLLIPVQIANYVESLPICKLAVSPKCDRVAVMSYARQLDIYQISGEILDHESSVQVLEEMSPEYCLLQFSSTSTLILSSRSAPHIDVFDNMGAFCYDIPLEAHEGIFDVNTAICGMQTVPNTNHLNSSNDKFIEILYVLQYSGVFSAFKIGRLSKVKYERMWSVQLDIGQTGSFIVLPQYNLLLVSSHHKESASVAPPAGLCSFRLVDGEPHVEPIRTSTPEGGFFSRLPFSTSFMTYLPKLSLSFDSQLLVTVATTGSLHLFEIPSLRVRFSFHFISGPRPVEACFVDTDEIAVIYDNGYLLRCSIEDLEERMYSMKVKSKKQIEEEPDHKDMYSEHTVMVAPAKREIFLLTAEGDNSVLREAAHKRVQLAGQLWFYTVWNSFKKLLGMAMGEPAEQLQMATHIAKFDFALIHSPTRTLQELFNRTLVEHDYTRARELAETYDTIDIDVVLKSEWIDKCSKNKVTVEDVEDILKRIGDSEWVAAQCTNVDSDDFEVHRALIDLGLSLGESSVTWQIRLLHHLRILEVCRIKGDVDAYMVSRKGSCLDAALSFAHNGDIDSLTLIIESNMAVMKCHQKRILSAIPSCTSPTKYEMLMPNCHDGEEEKWELEEQTDGVCERLHQILIEHPDVDALIRNINVGNIEDEGEFDFVAWVRETLPKIDFECGLTDICVNLLHIAMERGYHELTQDLAIWEYYAKYIRISSSVSESITSFQDSTVKSFTDRFSRLLDTELIEHAKEIVSLIQWKVNTTEGEGTPDERLREVVTKLMKATNERTTKVLVAYRHATPEVVDDHVILEVLLNMTSTGADLMKSLVDLNVDKYSNVTSSLQSLMSRGVNMTFKSIFESMKEPDGARRVLIKLSRSGNCSSVEHWISLRDDIYDMANGIYTDLVTTEEALELVAGEILEDERIGSHPELMDLVLTLNPREQNQDPKKLSVAKSAEVLLAKSDELMSEATGRNDRLLGKSRFFAVAARPISPKKSKEKLDWLDAIDAALELGCTMMPIAIKLSDHDTLLRDVVRLGTNYRQMKKVLSFAKQLNIDTPIATALSYCALAALDANDADCLKKYIGEIMKANGVPVVHQLCMKIMDSPHVPTDMEDVYSCAINNSNDENVLETILAIDESQKRLDAARRVKVFRKEEIPISENVVGDPMYTSLRFYSSRKEISEEMKNRIKSFENDGKRDDFDIMKRFYAHESSTRALCLSLQKPAENEETGELSWTSNDKLRRYERGLRFFADQGAPLSLLITAPASAIIREANKGDASITAIDRIEDYQCDRSRFIGDKEYRTESIIGLAGTENEQQFADALELGEKYRIDEWQLHMASLEYLLDPSYNIPRNDVKLIMKSRKHLSKLRTRPDDFHHRLRTMVLTSLETNEQFLAYTSLFAETEPEKKVQETIKEIVSKIKSADAIKMWTDAKYLSSILTQIPDGKLRTFINSILLIPKVGATACEKTADVLLSGTDVRPPANPYIIYLLLNSNVEEFLDLVSNKKSRDDEIAYLDHAVLLLDNTPKVPELLKEAVRARAEKMHRATVTPEPAAPSNGSGFASYFSSQDDNSGMMKRRKN